MFSIRKARLLTMMVGLGMLTGCELTVHPGPSKSLSTISIPTDQAMQARQWDVSTTGYVNDGVRAHPIYQPLQLPPEQYELNAIGEPVLFLANLIYLPVGVFIEYPWSFEVSKSLVLPPSYTLMPPLPDGAEPMPTIY